MPIAKSEIETFLAEYAAALAGRDPKIIATYWGVPAFVLSDEGAIAVGRAAETEQFFASSMEQYKNVVSAKAEIHRLAPLADTIAAAEIFWHHHDATGKQISSEAGHYMLKRTDDGLKIHVYTPKPA